MDINSSGPVVCVRVCCSLASGWVAGSGRGCSRSNYAIATEKEGGVGGVRGMHRAPISSCHTFSGATPLFFFLRFSMCVLPGSHI